MILAIDVGNTNIVLGCISDGNISEIIRLRTESGETAAGYAIKLKNVFELYKIDPSALEGSIISSVVPPVTQSMREAVKLLTGHDPMIVGPGIKTGMNVRIDDPGTLAGDLVVGSVAALQFYGAPVIVMDLGTANTIVLIDKDRCYRGGVITAGIRLSLEALASGTSLLPDVSISAPKKCIATNTVDSLRSGAIFGTAALLDGIIDRMEEEIGYKCTLVATGGLSSAVTCYCRHDIICDDDLLLKGLWYLYKRNK